MTDCGYRAALKKYAGSIAPTAVELADQYLPEGVEKHVSRIGSGWGNVADLVDHPVHGRVVRKTPRPHRSQILAAHHNNTQIYRDIKAYQEKHGPSGFARVHEVTPEGIIYQEYVQGTGVHAPPGKRLHINEINQDFRQMLDTLRKERPIRYAIIDDHTAPWNMLDTPKGLVHYDVSGSAPVPPVPLKNESAALLERQKRLVAKAAGKLYLGPTKRGLLGAAVLAGGAGLGAWGLSKRGNLIEKVAISQGLAEAALLGPAAIARKFEEMPLDDLMHTFQNKLWRTAQRAQGVPREDMLKQREQLQNILAAARGEAPLNPEAQALFARELEGY